MDLLIALIILAVVAAVFGSSKGKGRKKRTGSSNRGRSKAAPAKRVANREPKPDPYTLLYDHWKEVESGNVSVRGWYHDPVTEAQLNRLKEDGIRLPSRPITKGQASDLIGLGETPGPGQLEILRFFKVTGLPLKHESLAEIEIGRLFSDPEKYDQWKNRPATQIQKEYYRYFRLPVPKGLTAAEAEKTMSSHELTDDQDEEWSSYEYIVEEFQDKEFREDYEIKKPSIAVIRQAIAQHTSQGEKLTDISPDDLVDTILTIKPDLQKS